jgi:hypothetical protein
MRPGVSAALVGAVLVGATASACTSGGGGGGDATGGSSAPTTVANPGMSTAAPPSSTGPVADEADTAGSDAPAETTGGDAPPARLDPRVADGLDAAGFAVRLSKSHAVMVDLAADPADRTRAGVDHQLTLRALAVRSELDDAVLGAVDPSAGPAVERIVRARQFLKQRSASRPPQPPPAELPAWTIIEPEPVATLRAHYGAAEQLTGIAWYWLAAIHLQETRMGRIRGVSSAGAVGPMQFLPTTWEVCCTGDPTVTRDAIIGAATYLAQSGGPDDMAAALYEYNPNDGYVAVVTAHAESLRDEPELLAGYHAYQVFVGTAAGTIRLPVGYSAAEPIDAAAYLAEHPADAA